MYVPTQEHLRSFLNKSSTQNNDDDGACWICLSDDAPCARRGEPITSHLSTYRLGCACRRSAHVVCAFRWYGPRMNFKLFGRVLDQVMKVSVSCECETCTRGLDQDLLLYFMDHVLAVNNFVHKDRVGGFFSQDAVVALLRPDATAVDELSHPPTREEQTRCLRLYRRAATFAAKLFA